MTFEVQVSEKVCINGYVSPQRENHDFSLCVVWINSTGLPEDAFRSMNLLSRVFMALNPLGYCLAKPKGEDSVEVTEETMLTEVMASDDMHQIGMWLATDEFVIDEDQIAREIKDAVVGVEI